MFEKLNDKKNLNKWVGQFCDILRSLIIFYEIDEDSIKFEVIPAPYGGRFEMQIQVRDYLIYFLY